MYRCTHRCTKNVPNEAEIQTNCRKTGLNGDDDDDENDGKNSGNNDN